MTAMPVDSGDRLWTELWVSLASLLRSYTAAHGLNGSRQATVELGEERIMVRRGERWLRLERAGAEIDVMREDGAGWRMKFGEDGRIGSETGEWMEMDMQAESWARELMG
uniref:Uncharacterized protein n=1 Tax=mine drainage metagenome TaxID=410659 RepID=E6PZ79_9ZZZZ